MKIVCVSARGRLPPPPAGPTTQSCMQQGGPPLRRCSGRRSSTWSRPAPPSSRAAPSQWRWVNTALVRINAAGLKWLRQGAALLGLSVVLAAHCSMFDMAGGQPPRPLPPCCLPRSSEPHAYAAYGGGPLWVLMTVALGHEPINPPLRPSHAELMHPQPILWAWVHACLPARTHVRKHTHTHTHTDAYACACAHKSARTIGCAPPWPGMHRRTWWLPRPS